MMTVCVGCRWCTTMNLAGLYCMKKGKKVNNLRKCDDFLERKNNGIKTYNRG